YDTSWHRLDFTETDSMGSTADGCLLSQNLPLKTPPHTHTHTQTHTDTQWLPVRSTSFIYLHNCITQSLLQYLALVPTLPHVPLLTPVLCGFHFSPPPPPTPPSSSPLPTCVCLVQLV